MDAAADRRRLTRVRPAASRLHAVLAPALPLLAIFAGLFLIYAWQAWLNVAPWVVPDEFERAQLSRAIASTGHAAQRTVSQPFPSLYAYLIAPAWWIGDTAHAYAAAKVIGVVAMTSVVFPTYLLARMLVSKPWALFAAVGAAVIPALAYAPLLMLETVAYPWAALCFYLIVKALVTARPRWLIAAATACLVAPLFRSELGILIAAAAGAAGAFWFTGESGRRLRRGWAPWRWVGFVVIVAGVLVAIDVVLARASGVWRFSTQEHAGDMLRYGLRAFGALAIGVGVLPMVAGLASFVTPKRDPAARERRAFTCTAIASLICFGLYAAAKAAFIAPTGQPFLLERNVIYAAPLLMVGTAVVLDRRRMSLAAVVGATALTLYLVAATPYRLEQRFSFEAPGLSVLQNLHREIGLTSGWATVILIVLVLASAAVLILAGRMRSPLLLVGAAAFVLAWSAWGEIAYSRASHQWMNQVAASVPRPLDWVDRAVPHGEDVTYFGQAIGDPSDVLELEFWNRSIKHVWSMDGTAPGPGPTVTPSVVSPDGRLAPAKDVRYMVVDGGISPVGRVIARKIHFGDGQSPKPWTLLRVAQPLRLRQTVDGVAGNGWGGPVTAFNVYSIPNHAPSKLRINVSRHGLDPHIPATVRVRVGKLDRGVFPAGPDGRLVALPTMGKVLFTRTLHVPQNLDHVFTFRAPKPPFRVETSITPVAQHDLNGTGSRERNLGAYTDYLVSSS